MFLSYTHRLYPNPYSIFQSPKLGAHSNIRPIHSLESQEPELRISTIDRCH